MTLDHRWERAMGTDVVPIMDLTRKYLPAENHGIWTVDEQWFGMHITTDIVRQFYNPGSALVVVARSEPNNRLLGYVWVERGVKTVWSNEEMIAVKLVHVDMDLPARTRIRLITEMIEMWEVWAMSIGVNIVCSMTMRGDQTAFVRLHQRHGYHCRGSSCYKRIKPM